MVVNLLHPKTIIPLLKLKFCIHTFSGRKKKKKIADTQLWQTGEESLRYSCLTKESANKMCTIAKKAMHLTLITYKNLCILSQWLVKHQTHYKQPIIWSVFYFCLWHTDIYFTKTEWQQKKLWTVQAKAPMCKNRLIKTEYFYRKINVRRRNFII
jgi:hypothetical protein